MSRCPVCASFEIVVVLNESPRARCGRCGAEWIQEGSEQRGITRGLSARREPASLNIVAVTVQRSRQVTVDGSERAP
jgi:hypothetical protein